MTEILQIESKIAELRLMMDEIKQCLLELVKATTNIVKGSPSIPIVRDITIKPIGFYLDKEKKEVFNEI